MSESDVERRAFLKTAAGVGAAALSGAPAILAQRGANDRIGVAVVGVGTRGHFLLDWVQEAPNTEIRVICDLYDGNIQRAQKQAFNKKAAVIKEWEKAVASPDVDVVIIAAPDFWHAPMAIRAAENKKHIYVEKGLCRTIEEAKGIRKAVRDNGVTLQLGHHQNSEAAFVKAREIFRSGKLGKVTLARTYIDRTNPWPEWQFYTDYNIQQIPPGASASTIDWNRFVANAPSHAFDAERFFRWRCWWDYGTGIAGDLMSHQWDGVNLIAGMGIPESVQTQGGLYFWKQDREVPDMWHVLFDYPKKEMAVTFACSFHNRHHGTNTYIFGRDATIEVASEWCRVYEAEWKPESQEKQSKARRAAAAAGKDPGLAVVEADYAWKKGDGEVSNHMRNFIDSVRGLDTPRCGMDRAFEEAATIVMSVDSYFKERKVKWDPVSETVI